MRSEVDSRAKRPLSRLSGPYGHPIHPMLVTIPIGTWIASLVFDIASQRASSPTVFATGSVWLIGIGIIGALLAAIFGLMDLLVIPRGTRALATALLHMVLNLGVVALFVVSFVLRVSRPNAMTGPVSAAYIILTIVALGMLVPSGWLGGRLAYHFGVRVADERTQAEGFEPPGRPPEFVHPRGPAEA
jgi:uncharacterized membrane protein